MLDKMEFVIVGLNSIGRTLASLLATGVSGKLTLVDDKTVTARSIEQGYLPIDMNMLKVDALEGALREITFGLEVEKLSKLDQAAVDVLASKISGNTVLFYCEPISNKSKVHLCKSLRNSCQAIYFFGFRDDGSVSIFKYKCTSYVQIEDLAAVPEVDEKEVYTEGRLAASTAFAMYISSMARNPVEI